MKYIKLITMVICALTMFSCDKHEETELYDNNPAVDLSNILDAYKWYQGCEDENKDIDLISKISPNLPEQEFYLFEDTSFVVRLPEHMDSRNPVLSYAEDFYNTCCLGWNVWSNIEIWFRSQTSDTLRSDEDVRKAIQNISTDIIKDERLRKAAQVFKDSILILMKTSPEKWGDDEDAMGHLISFVDKTEEKAFKYYDDEDSFAVALDSVLEEAENLAQERFQRYIDADEENQLKVMLKELNSCKTFDEQCSLWRNWANCEKSVMEDEWLTAVGDRLMRSGNYSPLLGRIWLTWRALCQSTHFGMSRDSSIPNHYYNEYRRMCYISCLKRIERHPNDVFAIHCAYSTGGRINLLRFGESMMGNDVLMETVRTMPYRYASVFSDDDEEEEDGDEDDIGEENEETI